MNPSVKAIRAWLLSVIILIVVMVGVGGITRLTGSGLSITEWKPIMGVIPPLNEGEWQEAFAKYRAIPQFERLNSSMTLEGFKWIFFWEYLHRLIGRLIGVVYAIPLLWFMARGSFPRALRLHAAIAFFLGGAQGFLGWFMVKSGLSDLTYVSHFRLSAHLILAFLIAAYLLWIRYRLRGESAPISSAGREVSGWVPWIAAAVLIQTFYGALTAGLKAGYMYNTFPTLHGSWIHPDLIRAELGWLNLFNNPTAVQAIHRVLATGIVVALFTLWIRKRRALGLETERRALAACAHLGVFQYCLGISVVLLGVPVWAGTAHQVVGCLLFLATARLWMVFRNEGPRFE